MSAGMQYARDVVEKKIPACKWVILACQRHLKELKRVRFRAFNYRFDPDEAERWCLLVECFPHVKGKWARTKQLLKLEPWQCFAIMNVYGWLRKTDGLRRFRKVLWLMPRKNSKSTMAAPLGLGHLTIDGEEGAEVYTGATTEKQAWEIYRPAQTMAKRSPAFVDAFGITIGASNMHIIDNASRFEPLIGDPGDGASPSCALIDEYHEHATDKLVDTMVTGMGAREQPLLLIVTTAGDNLAGPCYAMQTEAQKMLEGVIEDDELFALIYTIDKDTDWTCESALRMANPNFDVSVSADFLRARQKEAIQNPRKAGIFKTKHLNVWVQARNAFFNVQRWQECERNISLDHFKGQPCKLGVDLASTIDIAALEIVFDLEQCDCEAAAKLLGAGFKFARFGRYYLPEDTVRETSNEHYQGWVEKGLIIETDGEMIDYTVIEDDIRWIGDDFQLEEIAFDPHQAMMMISRLQNDGFECVVVRQQVLTLSEPMKLMDGEIRSRRIAHDGDPVFTWMLSNVVAKADAKDNVYPRKERPENKIDGVVAHIMVKARMIADDYQESFYENNQAEVIN